MIGVQSRLYKILQLNPMFYIVSGYRDAFIIKKMVLGKTELDHLLLGSIHHLFPVRKLDFLNVFAFILQMFYNAWK